MTRLRADQAQFASLKSAIEEILGHSDFLKIRESGSFQRWQKAATRLLAAIELSISATIAIVDEEWKAETKAILNHGKKTTASAQSVDELFASLIAAFIRLSFL